MMETCNTHIYRDIVSTITIKNNPNPEHLDHPWEIRWKNKYHEWDDSKYWSKDLELTKKNRSIETFIEEQVDRALEKEYRQTPYTYRDITLEIKAEIIPKENFVVLFVEMNKYIDRFTTRGGVGSIEEQLDAGYKHIKKEIRRRIDEYLIDNE